MTSPQGNPARREPLLWLQLLGLAALPLEVAALLVVLAGADPGPLPGLERIFAWALGALGPAVLFWKLPPDLWSLLLLQVPLRGRRPDQLRLSALQTALPLKLLAAAGAPLLLPLLWWTDRAAGLAWSVSPFTTTPRVLVLLVAAALLALMLWQWQQILQALWMLSRPAPQVAQTLPLPSTDAAERRLNIGLPLLLLPPLAAPDAPVPARAPAPAPTPAVTPTELADPPVPAESEPEPKEHTADHDEPAAAPEPPEAPEPTALASDQAAPAEAIPATTEAVQQAEPSQQAEDSQQAEPVQQAEADDTTQGDSEADPAPDSAATGAVASLPVAIEPEQGAEQGESSNLDQQI